MFYGLMNKTYFFTIVQGIICHRSNENVYKKLFLNNGFLRGYTNHSESYLNNPPLIRNENLSLS